MVSILHFRTASEGWFGPSRLYVRTEDVLAWLDELQESHKTKAEEYRLKEIPGVDMEGWYGHRADEEEAIAHAIMIHKADFALTVMKHLGR